MTSEEEKIDELIMKETLDRESALIFKDFSRIAGVPEDQLESFQHGFYIGVMVVMDSIMGIEDDEEQNSPKITDANKKERFDSFLDEATKDKSIDSCTGQTGRDGFIVGCDFGYEAHSASLKAVPSSKLEVN